MLGIATRANGENSHGVDFWIVVEIYFLLKISRVQTSQRIWKTISAEAFVPFWPTIPDVPVNIPQNHIENQLFVARPYTTGRLYVELNWQWKTYFHYSFNITRHAIVTYEDLEYSANILPPPHNVSR